MVKALVEFQINNGMRIGELLAIKANNIDIENKTLEIDGTINWVTDTETGAFGVKKTTKTSRIIEQSDSHLKALIYLKHLY